MNTAIDIVLFILGVLLAIVSLADIKLQFISNRGYKILGIAGAIWFISLFVYI